MDDGAGRARAPCSRPPSGLAQALAAAALVLSSPAGCRSSDQPSISDLDLLGPSDLVATACAPVAAASSLAGRLRLVLFVGEGVAPRELAAHVRDLAAFYRPLGLAVEVAGPPAPLPMMTAFLGAAEGVPRAVARGAGDARFAAPLAALLREHGAPAPATINVVLLSRIASPSSAVAIHLRDLAGLTITTGVAAAMGLGDRPLRPTILLSRRDLERAAPVERRTTLAHEVGHALGLDHRREPANLMAQRRPLPCRPVLEADQRGVAARGLDALSR